MTDCNGCGRCCSPVALPYTQQQIARLLPNEWRGVMSDRQRDWVLNDLRPISRRDGLALVGDYMTNGGTTTGSLTATSPAVVLLTFFFECRHFDVDTRQCLDYDNRPEACSGYPWGDDEPDERKSIPPECSFNADVGVAVMITTKGTCDD